VLVLIIVAGGIMGTERKARRRHAGAWLGIWMDRMGKSLRPKKEQEPEEPRSRKGIPGLPAVIGLVTIGECPVRMLSLALQEAGFRVCRLDSDVNHWSAETLAGISLFLVCGHVVPEVYRTLRRRRPAPILALVPGGDEAEILGALGAGADDSQPLRISEQEMAARVWALLRRAGKLDSASQV
ncbi:MAG: hypothetical protein ACUVT1_05180, partial [Anaerolineae bacterium]